MCGAAASKHLTCRLSTHTPPQLLGFIVINLASGGAVKDTLGEVKVPGPGPPGMAEAKALKEKSKKKTQENYSKMINGGL